MRGALLAEYKNEPFCVTALLPAIREFCVSAAVSWKMSVAE